MSSLPSKACQTSSQTQTAQQLTVISPKITISHRSVPSLTSSTVDPSVHPSVQSQAQQSRVSRLYEGSHIHYSPVDNKPLCSYSTKLCKQRRINGYAFCIRHILEDKSAPFKQCAHVAKYNQQKCSNAIPGNEDRLFCNSHMQIAGMAPKKERKDKKSNTVNKSSNDVNCLNNSNDNKLLTNDKFNNNFNAFIKPSLKLNGISSNNNNNNKKVNDKCTTTTNETSISSHLNDSKVNNRKNIKRTKRKKKEKTTVDKFIFARKKKGDNLFSYHIWSSSDEEEDEDSVVNHFNINNNSNEDLFPVIFGTLDPQLDELESTELKNELIAQKWLLKNLISIRKKDLSLELETTRNILSTLNRTNSYNYLDYKLEENSKRSQSSITKGICCYSSEESSCLRPSLPYTRHCVEHILYNVDQLLFSRCTAKCSKTLTQCSRSTFDIIHEEPLCHYHQSVPIETEDRSNSPIPDGKNIKRRKKTKPMALTRVSRRGKKRRKVGNDIPVIEDSIDSKIGDEDSIHEESNDININLLAQKIEVQHNLPIPQTTPSPVLPLITPPLMRLPLMPTTTSASVVIDTSVMPPPPPLEPTEEALVASIVADLPQLTNDADFTEVLNKIPDDAFSDFLLEHQNGEVPSTEETEALEQALAMVNKDVQNLVAFAGMNGNNSQINDISGQSEILGFSNWLGSLTSEQRQQLNGLIDGAIASNSLSPILKNAYEAYPSTLTLPSSAPPVMKNSTTNTNSFPIVYPLNQMSIPSTSQEFVPISSPVPILNNNLLMNGLSSHPS